MKITDQLFKNIGNNIFLDYHVLPGLKTFGGIIGDDILKELGSIIDRKDNFLINKPNNKIPLKAKESKQVNAMETKNDHLTGAIKTKLRNLLNEHSYIFGKINDNEIVETNARAEIKTSTAEPIYTKAYPYSVNLMSEVEKQISKMLEDGITRLSKNPYNSPIWIVQYRLVVDFKQLNGVTVSDTYPISDIANTLASFGTSKHFTTFDLTSGFHQIKVKESDIPKTAFSTLNGKYEFTQLPFGLKNADMLKLFIGKICYVCIYR